MKLSTKQLKELNHLTCKSPNLTGGGGFGMLGKPAAGGRLGWESGPPDPSG